MVLEKVVELSPGQASILIDPMVEAYQGSEQSIREAAVRVLGKIAEFAPVHAPALVEPMVDALHSGCRAATRVIGKIVESSPGQAPGLLEPIVNACSNPDWDIKIDSREVLGKIAELATGQTPVMMQQVVKACKDQDQLGHTAIIILSVKNGFVVVPEWQAPILAEAMLALFKDPHFLPSTRCGSVYDALEGLTKAAPGSIPALRELLLNALKDEDVGVWPVAIGGIERIAMAAPEEAPLVVEPLVNACYRPHGWGPMTVLTNIVALAAPEQASVLVERMMKAILSINHPDPDLHNRFVTRVLQRVPCEHLMEQYWTSQNPVCIRPVVPRLLDMALTVQPSPKRPHHQRVVLHIGAGRRVEWTQREDVVQRWMDHMQQEVESSGSQPNFWDP